MATYRAKAATYRLEDIAYETEKYWALRVPKGYEVYSIGITHSTLCARIWYPGDEGLEKAKAEIARREARS